MFEKPRLGCYRSELSKDEPDLDYIKDSFLTWVKFDEYLIFRRENIHTFEKGWQ
jgi:hypothetical protein